MRAVSRSSVSTASGTGWSLAGITTGEQDLLRRLLGKIGAGMLVLADRNFLGHQLWAAAAATGADLLWRAKSDTRLPVVTALDALTEDEMVMILTETKHAMIKQYTKLFSMEGVRLTVTKDALRALAAQAVTKGTGARALRSMLERVMLDIMYYVPSREDIAEVTINRAVVEGKKLPLIRKKQDKTAA